jgi:putative endonuclease
MNEATEAVRRAGRRQASGARGERLAGEYLEALGWTILGRRVRIGRDEIDLLALEPGPPACLVVVEVRTRSSGRYGSPEESVDRRKIARLYRAAAGLRALGALPDGLPLPVHSWRVDLVAIDDGPVVGPGAGGPAIRHLRALEPY